LQQTAYHRIEDEFNDHSKPDLKPMALSEYELLRIQRMKRNAERLKELGLDQNPFSKAKPKKKRFVLKVKKNLPGQKRRSRRLSSDKKNVDLVMLDYRANDGEERVSKQKDYNEDESGDDWDTPTLTEIDGSLRFSNETVVYKMFGEGMDRKEYRGQVVSYGQDAKLYKIHFDDGDEEEMDHDEVKSHLRPSLKRERRRRSRTTRIDTEKWKLSEKDRESLANGADENFMAKFQEFLEFENRISAQNLRNVMRQARKLASGEGIRYEVCACIVT
jgi:hypothetical protein